MIRRLLASCFVAVLLLTGSDALAAPTGGSGGSLTDSTNLQYRDAQGVTSRYHLYAAGLDWSRPVGLIIYTDGSGEYGLKNARSSYLLAGSNGLVNVAKRNNMILLTPLAPGVGCNGGGTCWYATSSGYTPTVKARWSFELTKYVQSRYDIDDGRVAFGGYSSGAQWTTRYFGPLHAAQVMTDGVAVAISYGGRPAVASNFPAAFKANVVFSWDSGGNDQATNASAGARDGFNWYTNSGFQTELNIVSGVGHGRSGQFGSIMEREIRQHVRPAG